MYSLVDIVSDVRKGRNYSLYKYKVQLNVAVDILPFLTLIGDTDISRNRPGFK
jgi:hypothetical protein